MSKKIFAGFALKFIIKIKSKISNNLIINSI